MQKLCFSIFKFSIFALIFGLMICSCGEKQSLLSQHPTGVYRETVVSIPDNYGVFTASEFDGNTFYTPLYLLDNDGSYYMDRETKEISFDITGSNIEVRNSLSYAPSDWTFDDITLSADQNYLLTYTKNSKQIATIDMPRLFDYDIEGDYNKIGIDPVFSIIKIVKDKTENIYILTTEGICKIDLSASVVWKQISLSNIFDLIMVDDELLCLYGGDNEKKLGVINKANGELQGNVELPDCIKFASGIGNSGSEISFYEGNSGYDLYAATHIALYGIDIKLDKENSSCIAVECVNWLNSGLSPSSISELCIASDSVLTAIKNNDKENQLILLTKMSDDEIKNRKVLTLATLSNDYVTNLVLQNAIETFNRTNDKYSIVVTDFTVYENDLRTTLFNAEIAAGNIPDIVILKKNSASDSIIKTYEDSGLFCDLVPLMKNNEHFDYDGLLGYIKNPYTVNGEQYFFPLSPSSETQFGSSSYFNGVLTFDETVEFIKKLPNDVFWTNSSYSFKLNCLRSTLNDYIKDSSNCYFDSDEYISMLKNLSSISDKTIEGIKISNEYYEKVRNGELRIISYDPNSLLNFVYLDHNICADAVSVGYPNQARKLYVKSNMGVYFSITSSSENKDIAFDFLNKILSSFEAVNYNDGNYAFFSSDVFRQLEKYMDKTIIFNDKKALVYNDSEVPDTANEKYKLTEADAERYIAYLNSVDAILPEDSPDIQNYI